MAQQWEVQRSMGACVATGRAFQEGEEFYTVLFEDGDSFRRADYSLDAWQGPPEGSFCHFRSRVPEREKKKRLLVDDDLLIHFFRRLATEEEPVRVRFRFVLALILMRKRLLKYQESVSGADGEEVWTMTLTRDQSPHQVINPKMTDDQIEGVSRELTAILHGDAGQWAEEMDQEDGDPTDEAPPAQMETPANNEDADGKGAKDGGA
jgi:hypothetical protein